jgi:hypothetical protein
MTLERKDVELARAWARRPARRTSLRGSRDSRRCLSTLSNSVPRRWQQTWSRADWNGRGRAMSRKMTPASRFRCLMSIDAADGSRYVLEAGLLAEARGALRLPHVGAVAALPQDS